MDSNHRLNSDIALLKNNIFTYYTYDTCGIIKSTDIERAVRLHNGVPTDVVPIGKEPRRGFFDSYLDSYLFINKGPHTVYLDVCSDGESIYTNDGIPICGMVMFTFQIFDSDECFINIAKNPDESFRRFYSSIIGIISKHIELLEYESLRLKKYSIGESITNDFIKYCKLHNMSYLPLSFDVTDFKGITKTITDDSILNRVKDIKADNIIKNIDRGKNILKKLFWS